MLVKIIHGERPEIRTSTDWFVRAQNGVWWFYDPDEEPGEPFPWYIHGNNVIFDAVVDMEDEIAYRKRMFIETGVTFGEIFGEQKQRIAELEADLAAAISARVIAEERLKAWRYEEAE